MSQFVRSVSDANICKLWPSIGSLFQVDFPESPFSILTFSGCVPTESRCFVFQKVVYQKSGGHTQSAPVTDDRKL